MLQVRVDAQSISRLLEFGMYYQVAWYQYIMFDSILIYYFQGEKQPKLKVLKLDNSAIPSIRYAFRY